MFVMRRRVLTGSGQLSGRGNLLPSCSTFTRRMMVIWPWVRPIILKKSCVEEDEERLERKQHTIQLSTGSSLCGPLFHPLLLTCACVTTCLPGKDDGGRASTKLLFTWHSFLVESVIFHSGCRPAPSATNTVRLWLCDCCCCFCDVLIPLFLQHWLMVCWTHIFNVHTDRHRALGRVAVGDELIHRHAEGPDVWGEVELALGQTLWSIPAQQRHQVSQHQLLITLTPLWSQTTHFSRPHRGSISFNVLCTVEKIYFLKPPIIDHLLPTTR